MSPFVSIFKRGVHPSILCGVDLSHASLINSSLLSHCLPLPPSFISLMMMKSVSILILLVPTSLPWGTVDRPQRRDGTTRIRMYLSFSSSHHPIGVSMTSFWALAFDLSSCYFPSRDTIVENTRMILSLASWSLPSLSSFPSCPSHSSYTGEQLHIRSMAMSFPRSIRPSLLKEMRWTSMIYEDPLLSRSPTKTSLWRDFLVRETSISADNSCHAWMSIRFRAVRRLIARSERRPACFMEV